MAFLSFMLFVIFLRVVELIHARRNERWLLQNGAVEYGQRHYPYMLALHTLFFVSLITEYALVGTGAYSPLLILLFVLLVVLKGWVVLSLGKFWNTKIYRVADYPLVKTGVYKYIKHPNYMIVIAEIAIIPLAFGLYYTAVIFSVLNAAMLFVRIREENRALSVSK